jgi:hypothetical protein
MAKVNRKWLATFRFTDEGFLPERWVLSLELGDETQGVALRLFVKNYKYSA